MHLNLSPGAGAGGTWQEGAPGTGQLASKVGAQELNTLQNEMAAIVEEAGLVLDEDDDGQLLEAVSILFSGGNASAVLKNRVINGDFAIWQRGSSIAVGSSTTQVADRWNASADPSGSGAATVARSLFGIGQTNVPGGPKYFLRWTQTVNATGAPNLYQALEDVALYSSGPITVSFWARCSTNVNVNTRAIQSFGSGGSPAVQVGIETIALTSTWTRFQATYVLPSVAGKTIGPGSFLRVGFSLPNAATFIFDVADFQVELAEESSAFDRRPETLEHLLAFRYFEKSYGLEVAPGTASRAGALHVVPYPGAGIPPEPVPNLRERFRVPKRVSPTVTWYAPLGTATFPVGVGKVSVASGSGTGADYWEAVDVTSTTGSSTEDTGYPTRGDMTAHIPWSARNFVAHWTADAELA